MALAQQTGIWRRRLRSNGNKINKQTIMLQGFTNPNHYEMVFSGKIRYSNSIVYSLCRCLVLRNVFLIPFLRLPWNDFYLLLSILYFCNTRYCFRHTHFVCYPNSFIWIRERQKKRGRRLSKRVFIQNEEATWIFTYCSSGKKQNGSIRWQIVIYLRHISFHK